ncbi:F-box DNA helicase 1-like [Engraulis encrasicolus]|uniref:F-box DNA helicase 1-like n=1 Tax=Engraulis encrasicolus TaxID=184585 RepID=UPI002FD2C26D
MPAHRRRSLGQSPRSPYPVQHRRGRSGQPRLQQRTLDSYFGRQPVEDGLQRAPEPLQSPPAPSNTRIDALPEPLLRGVLAMLPAEDLFLRANRVSRLWHHIISQDGFCCWKKRYIRYHRQGEEGQREVVSILQENHLIPDNNLCLLHMARYISQTFQCMPRVSMADRDKRMLESIRTHRLYEQAIACMPESMRQTGEEESIWSALALMLVLAGGVGDMWQLVSRLRGPLDPGVLSELLWCTATLLRAMEQKKVKISNRLHYNIFYVLHLMENTSPAQAPPVENDLESNRENQMTQEQQHILNHTPGTDHVIKIMAFAGTGKTTTLVYYARKRPELQFLYVVFNKEAQRHATRIFPDNVSCKTIHSLAHTAVGERFRERLQFSPLKLMSVFWVLPDGERSIVWAKVVTKTINIFWASTDAAIEAHHVPTWYRSTSGSMCRPTETQKQMFLNNARRIWERMKAIGPTSEAAYRMYHDGYLKLWQLEGGRIMGHYDVIFIDEAQDCTPVTMDILLSQPCAKILVGDPHQHIYSFRGAVNNLDTIPHTHLYYLTQSFRFGPEIAYTGATILEVCKNVKKSLVGVDQAGSVRGQDNEMRRRFLTGEGEADGKVAILSRTNASIFHEAVRLLTLNESCLIYIIGGIRAFGLNIIQDIWYLKQRDNGQQIGESFIRRFAEGRVPGLQGYRGLGEYAAMAEDLELLWKIAVVDKYGERIPDLLNRIRDRQQTRQQRADFILGSMHKAKGLEFDTVFIIDDFRAQVQDNERPVEDDEKNLIYMAVTRAKRSLFMTKTIANIIARAGEHFLRPEWTNAAAETPETQCSIPKCSNKVNTNTRLCMSKLPIAYVDGVEPGGPLCLPCLHNMAGHLAFLMSPGIQQVPFP